MTALVRSVPIAGVIEFDVGPLVTGFALPAAEVIEHFRDGRRAQPIVARRLVRAFDANGWHTVPVTGGGARLVDGEGRDFDVRVVGESLSFAPSYMKGTKRSFDAEAFYAYYATRVVGVFVVDARAFPKCPYWRVDALEVQEWFALGALGKRGSAPRSELRVLLEGIAA